MSYSRRFNSHEGPSPKQKLSHKNKGGYWRTNGIFMFFFKYIMYNVEEYNILYNSSWVICEGWHFTHM
jgi:hypothetical protein